MTKRIHSSTSYCLHIRTVFIISARFYYMNMPMSTPSILLYIPILNKNPLQADFLYSGASEGNRTPNGCLGSNSFTIKLHLRLV